MEYNIKLQEEITNCRGCRFRNGVACCLTFMICHNQDEKPNWCPLTKQTINVKSLTKGYAEKCEKLNRIHAIANNYLYLDDMKKRNFYNCLWEIAEVLEVDLDEFGKEYIEDEKNW